ncbi:hypothetical protein Ae201684P_018001 [Aphanomyces euteiches]|nr:hypothetical protein Ae201684P_018001 [Aphanomyces euteiches]
MRIHLLPLLRGNAQLEPVVVTQVQSVVVASSPVGQGNYVAGTYVKSPTGEVQFVPAAQQGGYNSASVPPSRTSDADKSVAFGESSMATKA